MDKSRIAIIGVLLFLATGCSTPSTQEVGSDVTAACTLLNNPDEYRVGVLMVIGAAQNNPNIVREGRGNPYNYVNSAVREFRFPGVNDGSEAINIKSRFADALDSFATAYLGSNEDFRKEASLKLTQTSLELRDKCTFLGFEFIDDWQG